MLFNIVLDFGVGLVPFLGDIADVRHTCYLFSQRNQAVLFFHGSKPTNPQPRCARSIEQLLLPRGPPTRQWSPER
jgi:hypothetical protein